MSQDAYTCIEQLDLAGYQLEDGSPSYGRFALILTDNVVELIIHKICAFEISHDDMWLRFGKPRYTPEQRSDASGQQFDKKVKFCKMARKITPEWADAIQICHKYRNELYHSGLRYDDIVWSLAWYYHEVAAILFAEAYPDHSWGSRAKVTATVEKHAGKGGRKVLREIHEIGESLRQAKPPRKKELKEELSISAQNRVEEIEDLLTYLLKNDPQNRPEDVTIYELQFYDYILSEDSLITEIWKKAETVNQTKAAMDFVREIWEPKYKKNPLQNFRKRAKRILGLKNDLNALKAFECFKSEFLYFSRIIEEAAMSLDRYVENQIEAMRGN